MAKNPPARAGDMASVPGAGRFHVLQRNWAQEPQREKPSHSSSRLTAAREKPTRPQRPSTAENKERKLFKKEREGWWTECIGASIKDEGEYLCFTKNVYQIHLPPNQHCERKELNSWILEKDLRMRLANGPAGVRWSRWEGVSALNCILYSQFYNKYIGLVILKDITVLRIKCNIMTGNSLKKGMILLNH